MRFSTLLGYFINNEIIMMLIVGKNHRARFQISGGLLCSVVHRIVIDVFFQASYNAQGCQNFQKKNIYVKKKSKKKRCLFAHSFYFLPAILRYHCHFFVFVFVFLVICKKRMASALLAPALLVSRKSRIFTRFFYLKSSLGSLIGMCTNSRFFLVGFKQCLRLGVCFSNTLLRNTNLVLLVDQGLSLFISCYIHSHCQQCSKKCVSRERIGIAV